MKVLVTGGAGFIGSHIVDEYIKSGFNVIALDDLSHGKLSNVNKKAKFVRMDICSKSLYKVFKNEKIDFVNHHAAQISVFYSVNKPINDANINIIGSLNLLECCKEYKVKKIVFASSGGTLYGEIKRNPASEKFPLLPYSPYGISKLAIERYLEFYFKEFGLNYIALRYANVYGPRQDPRGEAGVVAIFADAMLSGKAPKINGDGKYYRDYVFCKDVAKANVLAIKSKINGSFNVGTSKAINVNELYRRMAKYIGFKKLSIHSKPRAGDLRRSVLSYNLIKSKIGWAPSVSFSQGLKLTLDYFKNLL